MEKLPSSKVIQVVEQKSKDNGSIIASDLAASAGIPLTQARRDLTTLCSLVKGSDIAVTSDGELLYRFPASLSGSLASNNAKYKALQTFQKAWPTLFWGIRVSFGVVLLVSLVAIFSTILFISASAGGGSSDSDDDRRRDDRGGGFGSNEFGSGRRSGGFGFGGGFGGFWGPSPFDVFYYRPYYGYYYDPFPFRGGTRRARKNPEEMGFLESIFSYVFGDGNPNQGLEERRLQLASQMIRNNNGAVTAEQLAVYCDIDDDNGENSGNGDPFQQEEQLGRVDESFVLPIVTALDGEPQVTDDGDIVYVFPELQVTAMSNPTQVLERVGLPADASNGSIKQVLKEAGFSTPRGVVERSELIQVLSDAVAVASLEGEEDTSLLIEKPYKFSLAPDIKKILAGALGVLNLGGALYLGNLLGQVAAVYGTSMRLPGYYGLVQSLYPLLFGYAVLFNAIPLVRNIWIGIQNAKIQQRNEKRRRWKTWLQQKNSTVRRKLQAARKLGSRIKQLGTGGNRDVIFDTGTTTMEEVQKEKSQLDLKDFDLLLEDDNGSMGDFQ